MASEQLMLADARKALAYLRENEGMDLVELLGLDKMEEDDG